MFQPSDFKPAENKKEAAYLLYGVVSSPVSTYCQIKAWAWCELGKILHKGTRLYEIIDTAKTETEMIDNTLCFEEALKLCPNDPFVLQLYGSHLRYNNQLQKSREVFQRVLVLRDENISRHHLALTLKKMVEKTRRNVQDSFSYDFRKQLTDNQHQSCSMSVNREFKAKIKSPRYVCISRDDPLLLEAVEHLKKSIEMCAGFNSARYDLGLIYRMLDKPDEALKYFAYITSSNCGKPKDRNYPMLLINAYEQQAICKMKLKEKESDKERKKSLEYDANRCMWNAIAVTSGVIGTLPMLRTTGQCFPTLKTLLQSQEQSSKTLKELAELHEKMGFTEESIGFYKKIIEMPDDVDPKILEKLVNNCLKVEDYKNACCFLLMLQYTDILKKGFDKSFYVSTYIKVAKISLEKKDFDLAKRIFLNVYNTIIFEPNKLGQNKENDESFPDVLILDHCGEDNVCHWIKPIKSTLESFVELHVAVNHMDCLPGKCTIEYLKKTMLKARCITICLHECDDANKDEFIKMALKELALYHLAKTLLIRIEGCNLDFRGCKELKLSLDPTKMEDDSVMQGTLLSNILIKMAEML